MLGFQLLGIVLEQLGTQWVCLFQIFFFLNYVVIFVVWQLFLFNSCGLFLLPCQYFQLLVPLLQAVLTAQLNCTTVCLGDHLSKKINQKWCVYQSPSPYSACTESWATVCFITGKMQREREARTGPPAAAPAGIRAIRERGMNWEERFKEQLQGHTRERSAAMSVLLWLVTLEMPFLCCSTSISAPLLFLKSYIKLFFIINSCIYNIRLFICSLDKWDNSLSCNNTVKNPITLHNYGQLLVLFLPAFLCLLLAHTMYRHNRQICEIIVMLATWSQTTDMLILMSIVHEDLNMS